MLASDHAERQTLHASGPAATTPVLPVLSGWRDFGIGSGVTSVRDAGTAVWLNSGSSAILLALRSAAVSSGDEVLIPAFNCPTMVTPVRAVGAQPVFYRISERLDLEIDDIAARVGPRTRAILAPHLFGRIQDLRHLRALCDEHGLTLIEDCAHLYFGSTDGLPVGSVGHYAIASPRKFFPLAQGGLLVSTERRIDVSRLSRSSIKAALRDAFDTIDLAVQSNRMLGAAWLIAAARRIAGGTAARDTAPVAQASGTGIDAAVPVHRASAATILAVKAYSHARVARKRRENYAAIRTRLETLRGMRLLDVQDPRAAPYMVPVILADPTRQFPALKSRGMPMWRWEYSIRGVCAVTDRYAESLIQLPCHQSLSVYERDTMLEILSTADVPG